MISALDPLEFFPINQTLLTGLKNMGHEDQSQVLGKPVENFIIDVILKIKIRM
jgi:hypothetical protein